MASATEQAVKRLEAALRSLEIALEHRITSSVEAEGLADEVAMLTADRAKLAENLDRAEARAARLDGLNRDASRRLGTAIATIRAVLVEEARE
jgi:hypothetical protein